MRTSQAGLDIYVAAVAELMERFGIGLTKPGEGEDLEVLEADDGTLSFELRGALPSANGLAASRVEVREELRPAGNDVYETSGYAYELVDAVADFRRAFHLHDQEWFARAFRVVVHAHCENPLGRTGCDHYEGSPIRDAFRGISLLVDTWMAGAPDCDTLRCLERD